MPVENIYSSSPSITVYNEGNTAKLCINEDAVASSWAMVNKIDSKANSIKVEINSEIDEKINKIKEEYENQLQKQKVHISRRDRVKGSRIHGRRCKIAISKRSFRNKKGIIGFPSGT